MLVPEMNTFCRCYDLIYVESGRVEHQDVYWFIDFKNNKRYYTVSEIQDKLREIGCGTFFHL